ncbi:MAG: hypothetical protein PHS33_07965 [Candidatus Omnitrophica bacterium]|nr:hypothetical protein [Candidatus Omnitrophota bacterium]
MNKTRLAFLLFVLVFIQGCKLFEIHRHQVISPPANDSIILSDSVVRTTLIIYRDTVIYIHLPGDTVYKVTEVFVPAPGNRLLINSDTSHLQTQFCWSWAVINRGELYHRLGQNDTVIELKINNYKKRIDSLMVYIKKTEIDRQNASNKAKFPWLALFFGILAISGILGILYYLIKNKR